jgi:hypothetical protein
VTREDGNGRMMDVEFMSRGSPFGHGREPDADAMLRRQRRMSEPDNEVPAPVPFTAVLGRTDDVAVCIVGIHVFTTGLSFQLAVRLRQVPPGLHHRIFEMVSGHRLDTSAEDRLLLGVELVDGRTASNVASDYWFAMDDLPDGRLVLSPGRGGGGRLHYDQRFWLSPLPPPGPVTFVCAWPALGLTESSAECDGQLLLDAAARAVVLWPPSSQSVEPEPPPEPPVVPTGWFSRQQHRHGAGRPREDV